MSDQLPEEVVRVHEKSLRMLDESQEELERFREMLRKAVVRLAIAARGEDGRLNGVLDQIRSAVKNDIDLERLDSDLDSLLVQVNQTQGGADDAAAQRVDLVSFAESIKQILGLETNGLTEKAVPAILDELVRDISGLVDVSATSATGPSEEEVADEIQPGKYLNKALIELLNRLSLQEDAGDDYQSICRQLDTDPEGAGEWKTVIEDIVALINKNIHVLQDEKKELQSFIKKITDQLAEIEQYVWQSRQERIETANESTKLKDSVDTSVVAIQQSVGSSDDISQLKSDVQGYLSEIRKSVEEHQYAEQEREEMSKQGYAHIISELARTQKETLMLKEQLHESQQKMLRDPLTGIPNRMAYEERIDLEVNRSRRNKAPLCLAMWDIDHFKKVNDTYGHDAGDRVLKLLTKIITTRVRKVDMFARIGGEEFVLVMPDTGIDDALNLNNQLRTNLEDSGFHYKGSPCPITASVGIAYIDESDSPDQLLEKADKALYQSKRDGRNRCTVFRHDEDK